MNIRKSTAFAAMALVATIGGSLGADVDYKTLKFGSVEKNFILQIRAVLDGDPKTHYLEMNTCFPINRWFSIGFGTKMANAEMVMFLAPPSEDKQNIVSVRTDPANGHKISEFNLAPPDVYHNFKKTINSTDCGDGTMNMYVQRLLNTEGLAGNNVSKSLTVG